jgi:hypothetical protein
MKAAIVWRAWWSWLLDLPVEVHAWCVRRGTGLAARATMKMLLASLVAVSLVGCATDPVQDGDSADTGGKADDDCESAAYKTWFTGTYLPRLGQLGLPLTEDGLAAALETAEARPCTTGSDADYTMWLGQLRVRTDVLVARQSAAFTTTVTTQQKYDAAVVAATPSAAEIRLLTALLAVAPERSGAAGYAAWVATYEPVLSLVYTGKGTTSTIFEANAVITAFEEPLLAALEDARPESAQEGAYAKWFAMYAPWNEKAFAPLATEGARAFAGRILAQRPAAHADIDYLTWFVAFQPAEAAAYATANSSSPRALAALDGLATALPIGTGGGARSYKPWFQMFTQALGAALGTDLVVTDAEKARLERLVTTKPCSTNPADAPLFAPLDARRAQLGEGGAYIARAAPVACAAP